MTEKLYVCDEQGTLIKYEDSSLVHSPSKPLMHKTLHIIALHNDKILVKPANPPWDGLKESIFSLELNEHSNNPEKIAQQIISKYNAQLIEKINTIMFYHKSNIYVELENTTIYIIQMENKQEFEETSIEEIISNPHSYVPWLPKALKYFLMYKDSDEHNHTPYTDTQ